MSECQTVSIQIKPHILSGLIWVQTVCGKGLSVDDTKILEILVLLSAKELLLCFFLVKHTCVIRVIIKGIN